MTDQGAHLLTCKYAAMTRHHDPFQECADFLKKHGVKGNIGFSNGAFHVGLYGDQPAPAIHLWYGIPIYYDRVMWDTTRKGIDAMTTRKLFLDDERFPPADGSAWAIVRSYDEAVAWVEANEFPGFVSFDNDLGEGVAEGWQFAQYLIDRDLDHQDMPDDFTFTVHSQNPVRRADIEERLNRYLAFRNETVVDEL